MGLANGARNRNEEVTNSARNKCSEATPREQTVAEYDSEHGCNRLELGTTRLGVRAYS